MNRTVINWGIGALFLFCTACTAEFTGTDAGEERPLAFSSVQAETDLTLAATRANLDIEAEGAKMGVFLKQNAPDYPADIVNRPYVFQGGAWQPDGGDANTIWLKRTTASMAAYYPYSSSLSQVAGRMGVVNLAAAVRNPVTPQDLWYKTFSASHSTADLSLTLEQAYCRMKVVFVLADTYSVEPYLYKLAVSDGRLDDNSATDGIFADATLDMFTTGGAGYVRGAKDYTPFDVNASSSAYLVKKTEEQTQAKFDLMMIPATLTDKVTFSTIVGGASYGTDTKPMTLDVPATAFGAGTPGQGKLMTGNIYTIKVTVNSKALSYTVDAQPWTDAMVDGGFVVD